MNTMSYRPTQWLSRSTNSLWDEQPTSQEIVKLHYHKPILHVADWHPVWSLDWCTQLQPIQFCYIFQRQRTAWMAHCTIPSHFKVARHDTWVKLQLHSSVQQVTSHLSWKHIIWFSHAPIKGLYTTRNSVPKYITERFKYTVNHNRHLMPSPSPNLIYW